MLITTLWSSRGLAAAWTKARAALETIRPHAVQLHGSPTLLKSQAAAVARDVRAALPGVEIWLAVAGDAGHTAVRKGEMTPEQLHVRRMTVAATARAVGGVRVVQINAEGYWKPKNRPPQGGFDEAAAARWVADLQAALPGVAIEHSAYAAVRGHSSYVWRGFLGAGRCTRSWFQIYEQHSVESAKAAVKRHLASCAAERARGVIGPQCANLPYLQMHYGTRRDPQTGALVPTGTHPQAASWMADQWADVALWAAGDRMTEDGIRLAQALAEIERRGFTGAGRIAAFQASAGLVPDSRIGLKTLRALGMP